MGVKGMASRCQIVILVVRRIAESIFLGVAGDSAGKPIKK